MGKLRLASGLRRPPALVAAAVLRRRLAAYAYVEDLQDELQGEWNDWTPDKFTGYGSEGEFDSTCSEWDDGEAVDRAKEWLGWSPIDREADGYGYEDQREDNVPLDDSTWGECGEGRLADDRRLQDMVDATPAVVIRCAWEADGRVGNSKHGILRRRCFQRGIRPRPCRGLCHRVAGAGERPGAQAPVPRELPDLHA